MTRRVLVASEFNARNRAHFSLSWEFCHIIAACDEADIVAPGVSNYLSKYLGRFLPPHDSHNVQRDFNRLVNGVRKGLGLRNMATIEPVRLEQDYDLFFFVAWSPQSLVELARIPNWRKRCKVAVLYLFELWTSTLEQDRPYLRLLDQFDHVFLLHTACIPKLPAYTRAPCSYLPTGVDCMVATPYPAQPERVVDVYSIGNRSAQVHGDLLSIVQREGIFYVYDSLASTDSRVKDWGEHRQLLAETIKRTRYFITFSPASLTTSKADKIAGEQVLPSRLFEGAAGGAIMLGTAPECPEFAECFDWADAVIDVDPNAAGVDRVIAELDAQPERTEAIRRTGAVQCLLRHDWVYRWEKVLAKVGMEALPQLERRKAELRRIAGAAMLTAEPDAVEFHKDAAIA